MSQETIVTKIRKLLRMADERGGASAQERETAMRMAERLMAEHAISMSEIDAPANERGEHRQRADRAAWKHLVWGQVGKLYGCAVYRSQSTIVIIGREAERATVVEMARWVIASIMAESQNVTAGYRARAERNAFRLGAARGLTDQVNKILRERREAAQASRGPSAGRALVVADYFERELEAARAMMPRTVTRRASTSSGSWSSYGAGRAYGQSINLSRQVVGSGKAPPQLR